VVSTPLKYISQLGLLFLIYGKIKKVPNHQPDIIHYTNYPNKICDIAAWAQGAPR
jgi:hypothetical protein